MQPSIGCLTIIVGSIVISTAAAKPQFIAGRFILGMGIAVAITGAPTYTVEVAPPQWRFVASELCIPELLVTARTHDAQRSPHITL